MKSKFRKFINEKAGYGLPFLISVVGGLIAIHSYPGDWVGEFDSLKLATFSFAMYPALFTLLFSAIFLKNKNQSFKSKLRTVLTIVIAIIFFIFGISFITYINITYFLKGGAF